MTTTSFAVVEFIGEKSVEIVCEKWIETCDGVSMVYFSDYKHQYVYVMIIQLYGSFMRGGRFCCTKQYFTYIVKPCQCEDVIFCKKIATGRAIQAFLKKLSSSFSQIEQFH